MDFLDHAPNALLRWPQGNTCLSCNWRIPPAERVAQKVERLCRGTLQIRVFSSLTVSFSLHMISSPYFVTRLSEGFNHFVTSIVAPVASGWSGCRAGLAPAGKRRLCTAHATTGRSGSLKIASRPTGLRGTADVGCRPFAGSKSRKQPLDPCRCQRPVDRPLLTTSNWRCRPIPAHRRAPKLSDDRPGSFTFRIYEAAIRGLRRPAMSRPRIGWAERLFKTGCSHSNLSGERRRLPRPVVQGSLGRRTALPLKLDVRHPSNGSRPTCRSIGRPVAACESRELTLPPSSGCT